MHDLSDEVGDAGGSQRPTTPSSASSDDGGRHAVENPAPPSGLLVPGGSRLKRQPSSTNFMGMQQAQDHSLPQGRNSLTSVEHRGSLTHRIGAPLASSARHSPDEYDKILQTLDAPNLDASAGSSNSMEHLVQRRRISLDASAEQDEKPVVKFAGDQTERRQSVTKHKMSPPGPIAAETVEESAGEIDETARPAVFHQSTSLSRTSITRRTSIGQTAFLHRNSSTTNSSETEEDDIKLLGSLPNLSSVKRPATTFPEMTGRHSLIPVSENVTFLGDFARLEPDAPAITAAKMNVGPNEVVLAAARMRARNKDFEVIAMVGAYDPVPLSWGSAKDVIEARARKKRPLDDAWARMKGRSDDMKKHEEHLGPGCYSPQQQQRHVPDAKIVFKSGPRKFNSSGAQSATSCDIAPGCYSLEPKKVTPTRFIPFVQKLHETLGRMLETGSSVKVRHAPPIKAVQSMESVRVPKFSKSVFFEEESIDEMMVSPLSRPRPKTAPSEHYFSKSFIIDPALPDLKSLENNSSTRNYQRRESVADFARAAEGDPNTRPTFSTARASILEESGTMLPTQRASSAAPTARNSAIERVLAVERGGGGGGQRPRRSVTAGHARSSVATGAGRLSVISEHGYALRGSMYHRKSGVAPPARRPLSISE